MLLLASYYAEANTIRIAIVDSGLNYNSSLNLKVCPTGSKDFTGQGLQDNILHGTHVAGLIAQEAKDSDYCVIILKIFSTRKPMPVLSNEAIEYAISLKVDYINYSAGGPATSKSEVNVFKKALDVGITVVVAAGNEGHNLDTTCNYYPACVDSRIIVVGNLTESHQLAGSSNYGSIVDVFEIGTNRAVQMAPNDKVYMSGTSMSCALHVGKLVYEKDQASRQNSSRSGSHSR